MIPPRAWLMVVELALGIGLCSLFFEWTSKNDSDALWGKTIADGILRMYGYSSLIFFISVYVVGIPGAKRTGRSNRIGKAVGWSILFWFLSLPVSYFIADVGFIPSLLMILVGIIVGFNIGLERSSKGQEPPEKHL